MVIRPRPGPGSLDSLGLDFFGANWILEIGETRKDVSDGQVVRVEVPLAREVPAHAVQVEVRVEVDLKEGRGGDADVEWLDLALRLD